MNQKRLGIVGIIIGKKRKEAAPQVNEILTQYGDIIAGRMGLPYSNRGYHIITLIVDGTTDEIGALTGKLGMLEGVTVKSVLTSVSVTKKEK